MDPNGKPVRVPSEQAPSLMEAGYKERPTIQVTPGDVATSGAQGAIAAGLLGLGKGASMGGLDFLIPKSLQGVERQVEAAHPNAALTGTLAGSVAPGILEASLLPAWGRIAAQAVQGGVQEAARAHELSQPINAERILQGVGYGALWGLGGEAAGQVISKAIPAAQTTGNAFLKRIAKYIPKVEQEIPHSGASIDMPEFTPAADAGAPFEAPWNKPNLVQDAQVGAQVEAFQNAGNPMAFKNPAAGESAAVLQRAEALPEGFAEPEVSGMIGPNRLKATYKPFFDNGSVAGGLARLTALKTVPFVAGPLEAANIGIPKALNHLDTINSWLERLAAGPAQNLATAVRGLVEGTQSTASAVSNIKDIDKDYAEKSHQVQSAAMDPIAVQEYMEREYGHVFAQHPELAAQIHIKANQAAQALNQALPRDPQNPTVQTRPYNPPLSAKIRWLSKHQAITDPVGALQNPTPEKVQMVQEAHPETLNLARLSLQSELQKPRAQKLSTAQARKISTILGVPVRPETSGDFLGRLIGTGVATSQPSEGPKVAPSAVTTKQAATMEETPMQQQELGQ